MKSSRRMIATAAFAAFLMPALLFHAGDAAAQTQAATLHSGGYDGTPKVDLFLGYSYLQSVPKPADGNRLVWMNGASTSIAFNLNRHLGLVADVGDLTNSEIRFTGAYKATVDVHDADGGVITYLFGPRLSFRNSSRVTPFVQALFGGAHASEIVISKCTSDCTLLPTENAFAMTAGGGLDVRIHRHFALRLIQAEYLMTRFKDYSTGETSLQNDMRLSSGIVFRLGGNAAYPLPPPLPITYFCSVTPSSVFPGEPIAASGTALNLNPARTDVYTWSVDGGTVTGSLNTAKIDTTNLAPGAYTLKCHVSQGDTPNENADATAPYVVKAFEPPTISCVANPNTIKPGETSTVTAMGVSPQNRPLTYSYSASAGTVTGSGTTAAFDSTGAAVGAVGITCNVTDDKSQVATASTSVTVAIPSEPPIVKLLEARLALHSVFFATDQPTIEKINGGLVVSQEKTLTTLATDFKQYLELKPDAHLTLTGHADVRGSVDYNQALSERRVTSTKLFLVEKGVPEAKIETLGLGKEDDLSSAQVEEAVKNNPELNSTEREKLLDKLPVIVLAKNRRVDITLSTTGQQSVQRYPFNAADALILLEEKNLTHKKKAAKK